MHRFKPSDPDDQRGFSSKTLQTEQVENTLCTTISRTGAENYTFEDKSLNPPPPVNITRHTSPVIQSCCQNCSDSIFRRFKFQRIIQYRLCLDGFSAKLVEEISRSLTQTSLQDRHMVDFTACSV